MAMNVEKFAAEAFRNEPKLRYVGIVDNFHIVLSKMREGVQSLTTDQDERNFTQIMPPIIIDAVEKMQPMLGKLNSVTIRYENVLLVFFRMQGLVVVFSFDPDVSTPFINTLSDKMLMLGATYLT